MSDKNKNLKKSKKPCFGAIFTTAGRLCPKKNFPKNLAFVMQNRIRSLIPWQVTEKNIPIPRKVMNGCISSHEWGSKKEKKDAEQCPKDSAGK